ncbi:MAG: hypothetical protein K0M69_18240, partial [Youngiibacter sp.]|nr:hypothetical protein [Youngiibacter sp.]
LRFINENIFAESMSEEEFNYIVRDIKLDVDKDGECEVADYIMNKYRLVFYASNLYFYLDGEYRNDHDLLRRIIYQEVGAQKTRFVDEVLKQLEYRSPIISDKAFDIKFKNGILRAGEFYEIDYDEFTPYVIDVNYRENAEPVKEVDDYVQLLTNGDEKYRDLLFEILAHTLIVDKEFKRLLAKFFIFVGDGGNGKGTLLTIIRKILNAKNCTGLSIKNMSDERYFVTMKGKLANLGDDIDDQPINNEQMKQLKNISTCDFVATRELFKQSKETELTISLIFTSNHILKSFEKGESYRRRVLWLPMYTKPTKKDPLFISKLTTEKALEYWISLIIEGYRRLYHNATFTESELVGRFNKEYHEDNNGVLLYLRDHRAEDFKNRKPKEVWQHFEIWAEENDVSSTPKMLKEAIMQNFSLKVGVKKINGVSCRVYMDM